MNRYLISGLFVVLILIGPAFFSLTAKAEINQQDGDVIFLCIVGKYLSVDRELDYPFITLNLYCELRSILVFGYVWDKPPGYASPVPKFIISTNTIESFTITNFIGICRLHHIIGFIFP